jgi:homogentisate 1,2-dioxygenase
MLIMPQQGRLDLQTEFGRLVCLDWTEISNEKGHFRLMVRPGEIFVVQRGIKFKVRMFLTATFMCHWHWRR